MCCVLVIVSMVIIANIRSRQDLIQLIIDAHR